VSCNKKYVLGKHFQKILSPWRSLLCLLHFISKVLPLCCEVVVLWLWSCCVVVVKLLCCCCEAVVLWLWSCCVVVVKLLCCCCEAVVLLL